MLFLSLMFLFAVSHLISCDKNVSTEPNPITLMGSKSLQSKPVTFHGKILPNLKLEVTLADLSQQSIRMFSTPFDIGSMPVDAGFCEFIV